MKMWKRRRKRMILPESDSVEKVLEASTGALEVVEEN